MTTHGMQPANQQTDPPKVQPGKSPMPPHPGTHFSVNFEFLDLIGDMRAARETWGRARRGGYNEGARRMAKAIDAFLEAHDEARGNK